MKGAKRSFGLALLGSTLGIFLFLSSALAQEKPDSAEPAKIEAPVTAPAALRLVPAQKKAAPIQPAK